MLWSKSKYHIQCFWSFRKGRVSLWENAAQEGRAKEAVLKDSSLYKNFEEGDWREEQKDKAAWEEDIISSKLVINPQRHLQCEIKLSFLVRRYINF